MHNFLQVMKIYTRLICTRTARTLLSCVYVVVLTLDVEACPLQWGVHDPEEGSNGYWPAVAGEATVTAGPSKRTNAQSVLPTRTRNTRFGPFVCSEVE